MSSALAAEVAGTLPDVRRHRRTLLCEPFVSEYDSGLPRERSRLGAPAFSNLSQLGMGGIGLGTRRTKVRPLAKTAGPKVGLDYYQLAYL